jgi:hypothetical protein
MPGLPVQTGMEVRVLAGAPIATIKPSNPIIALQKKV